MRPLLLFAALAALSSSPAMSQSTSIPNAAPWDQPFLPPAPAWDGASKALLRPATDPWASAFEQDPEHDFSPNYADTRAWFDRLDVASDLIRIEPFDSSTLTDIDRAIRESRLGLNGSIEGKVIRLPIPALSQERREQMVKMCKQLGEEARVRVRSARRSALEALKAGEKESSITEDDLRRLEKDVQTMTDKKIAEIDQHVVSKEKEILTV